MDPFHGFDRDATWLSSKDCMLSVESSAAAAAVSCPIPAEGAAAAAVSSSIPAKGGGGLLMITEKNNCINKIERKINDKTLSRRKK